MGAHRPDEFGEAELRRIEARWKSDVDLKIDRMDTRLRTIERLVWIGLGGIIVLGGLVSIVGNSILKVLGS